MKNGTVPPIGYICPCTLYIYYAHCKGVKLVLLLLEEAKNQFHPPPRKLLLRVFLGYV